MRSLDWPITEKKMKLFKLPKGEGSSLKYRVPPLWPKWKEDKICQSIWDKSEVLLGTLWETCQELGNSLLWLPPPPLEKNWKKKKTAPQHKMIASFCLGVPTLVPFWSQGQPAQEWKCVHVSENRVIVSKIFFNLVVNIPGSIGNFFYFVVYGNDNVSMHHIPSCTMSSCIILYHQHKSYGTYVLCKEGWGKFQNNYMHKKLYRWTSRCLFTIL
jgi:hypothetical protein